MVSSVQLSYAIGVLLAHIGVASSQAISYDYTRSGVDWPGVCQTGKRQSPINLVSGTETFLQDYPPALRPNLDFGTGTNVQVINTGRYFEVVWKTLRPPTATITLGSLFGQPNHVGPGVIGPSGSLIPGNGEDRIPLTPVQWHMHTPSEHSMDGKLSLIEAHLVTSVSNVSVPACGTGCFAVYGVLYDIAPDTTLSNTFLTPFLSDLPEQIGEEYATNFTSDFVLDFADYFPLDTKGFVSYPGSLTTPPCTENVLWTVLLSNPAVSVSQVVTLANAAAATVRPLQCRPVPASELDLEQSLQPIGTYQVCTQQGQRDNDRFPQPTYGRPVFGYS
ncbi:hypothetical protein WJX74_004730 [Apatococcus lobatus]|uniref:carbonic anhydrase n=1 Tax=Apatococcus lobatus TaxID=904363 RepID=A0AAW1QTX5_9CHLO